MGYTTNPRVVLTADHKTIFVGTEAVKNRAFLTLQRPIQFGRVVDMESLEIFVSHLFYYELKAWPTQLIVLVHSSFNKKKELADILFNKLGVKQLQYQLSGIVPLLKHGSQTAISLDATDSGLETFALYNGQVFEQSVTWNDVGARRLSELLGPKVQFVPTSESDMMLLQEHFSGQRNELKMTDQMRNELVVQNVQFEGLLRTIAELPIISRGIAAKHLVLSGQLAKLDVFKQRLTKFIQEAKTQYSFQFQELGDCGYEHLSALDQDYLWVTKEKCAEAFRPEPVM